MGRRNGGASTRSGAGAGAAAAAVARPEQPVAASVSAAVTARLPGRGHDGVVRRGYGSGAASLPSRA